MSHIKGRRRRDFYPIGGAEDPMAILDCRPSGVEEVAESSSQPRCYARKEAVVHPKINTI